MTGEEIGIMFAGVSSVLGVLIYFTKNVKESSCCGSKCKQVVLDTNNKPIISKDSMIAIPALPPQSSTV